MGGGWTLCRRIPRRYGADGLGFRIFDGVGRKWFAVGNADCMLGFGGSTGNSVSDVVEERPVNRPITLKNRLEYVAYQAVAQTIGNLPLGGGTGTTAAVARSIGMRTTLRRRAEKNLAFALPDLNEGEREEILIGMFDNLARVAVEYRYLRRLSTEAGRFQVSGLEHIDAAREAGRGAILATGHFGNWEMIRVAFARHGWPPALIYRAFNNPLFDESAAKMMRTTDAPLFHKGRRGSLGMLRHVRAGGCTLILTDQRFSGAPNVPFFGKPAQTSVGAAEIALNYDAALIPVRCERIGRTSRFEIIVEPPMEIEGQTPEEVTTRINSRLESWVRGRPDLYFWMHNRWGKEALRLAAQ